MSLKERQGMFYTRNRYLLVFNNNRRTITPLPLRLTKVDERSVTNSNSLKTKIKKLDDKTLFKCQTMQLGRTHTNTDTFQNYPDPEDHIIHELINKIS